jgi:hypothetical protein
VLRASRSIRVTVTTSPGARPLSIKTFARAAPKEPLMDLRYLEFLLAAYSWAVIVFAAIMVLWLVLNNITEIAVAGIKVKPSIAFRSFGSLIVLMALFSICTNYLVEQIPPEIQLQDDQRYAANQDQNQAKEKWRAFFEKITHETDTMAFAFIRIERPDPQSHNVTLTESSVQYVLKIALYWLPIMGPTI